MLIFLQLLSTFILLMLAYVVPTSDAALYQAVQDQADAYFEASRQIQTKYPQYSSTVDLMKVYPSMSPLARDALTLSRRNLSMHVIAAVLLEDSFLRDVFHEFATRDTNRDGDLSHDELWTAVEEFNADEQQSTSMFEHCTSSTQESTEAAAAFAVAAPPLVHAPHARAASNAMHSSPSNTTPTEEFSHDDSTATAAVTNPSRAQSDASHVTTSAALCPPLGYAYTRAYFDAFALENDVDELSILENTLYETLDSLERAGDPEALGLLLDDQGNIVD